MLLRVPFSPTYISAVKPHNTGGLFAIMTLLGVTSITMLPVGLELGCDLTRNAEGSSALLWFGYVYIFPLANLSDLGH